MVVSASLKTRVRDTATGSVSIARPMRILPMMERKPMPLRSAPSLLASLVVSRFFRVPLSYNLLDMLDDGLQGGAGTIIPGDP